MKKAIIWSICLMLVIAMLVGCANEADNPNVVSEASPSPVVNIEHSISEAIDRYLSGRERAYAQIGKLINITPEAAWDFDKNVWQLCVQDKDGMAKPVSMLARCEKERGVTEGKDEQGNDFYAAITTENVYRFHVSYSDEGLWVVEGEYDPVKDSLKCDFFLEGEHMRAFEFAKQTSGGYAGQTYARYDGDTFYCARAWFDDIEEGDAGFSAQEYSDEPGSIYQNSQVAITFVEQGVPYAYTASNVFTAQAADHTVRVDYNEEEIVAGDFAGAQYDNHISTGDSELSTELSLPLKHMIPALYFNNLELKAADYYFYQPRNKPRYLFISTTALGNQLLLPHEGELLSCKVERKGRDITLTWASGENIVKQLSMKTNSTILVTPEGEVDMGIRPSARSRTVFVPMYAVLNAIGGGVSMGPSAQNVYHIYTGEPLNEGPMEGVWSNRADFTGEVDLRDGKYALPKGEELRVWSFDEIGNCRLVNLSFDTKLNKWSALVTEGTAQLHGRILAVQWMSCSKSYISELPSAAADWELVYSALPPSEAQPPVKQFSSAYIADWTQEYFSYKEGIVYHRIDAGVEMPSETDQPQASDAVNDPLESMEEAVDTNPPTINVESDENDEIPATN